MKPRVPAQGNKASKPLTENTCGGWGSSGKNSQTHRRVHWRDPQGSRMYTIPPTRGSAPEGPNLIVGNGESDWKLAESAANGIVPSQVPLPHTASQRSDNGLPRPGEHLRLCPLYVTGVQRQKKDQRSRKNTTKQWRDSQPIRCTAENTGYQDDPGTH